MWITPGPTSTNLPTSIRRGNTLHTLQWTDSAPGQCQLRRFLTGHTCLAQGPVAFCPLPHITNRIIETGTHMTRKRKNRKTTSAPPSITLPGTVQKIIPSILPDEPEKAQIAVQGADHLYRELRVENVLENEEGKTVALKEGAAVEVTIEAEPEGTVPDTNSLQEN